MCGRQRKSFFTSPVFRGTSGASRIYMSSPGRLSNQLARLFHIYLHTYVRTYPTLDLYMHNRSRKDHYTCVHNLRTHGDSLFTIKNSHTPVYTYLLYLLVSSPTYTRACKVMTIQSRRSRAQSSVRIVLAALYLFIYLNFLAALCACERKLKII
jgi:hypothetical protein